VKILLVGDYPDDPRLGSGKVYHKLREEIVRLGHSCDVLLAPQLGPRPGKARVRWLVGPALAARAVARASRERGPYDVVDVASAEGALLGHGAAIVSRSHGLEHLNFQRMVDDHRHGLAHKPWYRRLWYPAARMSQVALAARRADRMIVLNAADRDFVLRRGWKEADAVELIPHGVSRRFLDAAPSPDAPRGAGILFCGSWDAVKGVHYLVRAMERLATEGRAPRLTVLGPGLPAEAVLAAFPPGVRRCVTVIPRTDEESVMRHYREHDLLVMPSTYEGFGMVVAEAMSQRLPVVATAVGGAPALLRGGNGILVPPRATEELAAAVGLLLDDEPLRRRLGDAGHERVRGMSWTETARRTLACYRAAMGARR
jgi:glycosyltransferase involved in cell wall biosynthesis